MRILESRTVRYSSPRRFNDPFDVQSGLHLDFDPTTLPQRILDRYKELAQSENKPNVDSSNPHGKCLLLLWQNRERGFPSELQALLRPQFEELTNAYLTCQKQYQQIWWDDFLPRLRVFCVTEEKDNLLMWAHYADSHAGVVFEFAVLPEQDNPLCAAGKVVYQKNPTALFTLDQILDDVTGIRTIETAEMLRRYGEYAYLKCDVWAYEKEWRVWDLPTDGKGESFGDYTLREGEIAGVYFGCKSTDENRKAISSITRTHFPNAELFTASKARDAFSLVFEAL